MDIIGKLLDFVNAHAPPPDKALHFISGLLLYMIAASTAHFLRAEHVVPAVVIPLGLIVVIGITKEIYDLFHRDKHTPDAFDAIATATGGVVAAGFQLFMSVSF